MNSCLEIARNGRFCAGAEEYERRIKELESQLISVQQELREEKELRRAVQQHRDHVAEKLKERELRLVSALEVIRTLYTHRPVATDVTDCWYCDKLPHEDGCPIPIAENLLIAGDVDRQEPDPNMCCVKGCYDGSVVAYPPLCDHHTSLLEHPWPKYTDFCECGIPDNEWAGVQGHRGVHCVVCGNPKETAPDRRWPGQCRATHQEGDCLEHCLKKAGHDGEHYFPHDRYGFQLERVPDSRVPTEGTQIPDSGIDSEKL